ncbi:M1 family aminopeptidase [Fulvivirgaceae bacterium BMA12]|uniref:Aminopeptidase N n=1 Tax=Agaribacillus aureus TaxID=3051825 RepID=A0ABT8L8P9_9BACT|nr:M1 family aminopeptidase [Fulvivirgaceae bacterium BMA12]
MKNSIALPVFSVLLVAISCQPKTAAPPAGYFDPGISMALSAYRHKVIDQVNYALDFVIPEASGEAITATANISFNLQALDFPVLLDFDTTPERISDYKINGNESPVVLEDQHLVIAPGDLVKGKNEIIVSFGVDDFSLNRNEEFLYTLYVPARASKSFPCFDQPNLKATYALSLTIPKSWSAVANGRQQAVIDNGPAKTIQYTKTKPISTYLFAFAAGKFDKIERRIGGRDFVMWHRETDSSKVARNKDIILDLHAKAYDWLENYTGIDYPFEDYEILLIPDFQYGGMEHPGAIWYNASSLFLNDNPTRNQQLRQAQLISHEVAHMWFGNLVTMDWFDDVWLKEVFANFMAEKIIQPDFKDIDLDLIFLSSHYPTAYQIDRSAGSHPIQQELPNLSDAGSLYGSIIYHKAPIVMKHLETTISEKVMQQGLAEYLKTFSFSNATWDDLINILGKTADMDLTDWSRDWIKTAGMPYFSHEFDQSGEASLVIRQTGNKIYKQQLNVELIHGKSRGQRILIESDAASVNIKLDDSEVADTIDFVNLFGSFYEYGYHALNEGSVQWLLQHVNRESQDAKRFVLWMNLWENFLNARVKPLPLMEQLLISCQQETNPRILSYTTSRFQRLYWYHMTRHVALIDADAILTTIWARIKSEESRGIKRQLWNLYSSIARTPGHLDRIYKIWEHKETVAGLTLSEDDFVTLARNLVLLKHAKWQEILAAQPGRISNPDRLRRFKFVTPALSNDSLTRSRFFESLKVEENRNIESWVLDGLSYLHHPTRTKHSVKFIPATLRLVRELQATGDIFFPGRFLDISFNWHVDSEVSNAVTEFLDDNPDYPGTLKNKILQGADVAFRMERVNHLFKDVQ